MELFWIRVAAVMYGLASLAALPAVLGLRPRYRRVCTGLAVAGFMLQAVALVERTVALRRLVPANAHQLQFDLGLLVALAFLLIAARYRTVSFGLFALPIAFLLVLPSALGVEHYTFSSPLERGGWIAVHVTTLLAADTALVFSLLASLLYLAQERRLKDKQAPGFFSWMPPLDTMDRIAQTTLVLGFICMTVGLFAGSLIAQERVGASYFEDPKVLLSFGMWLIYVLLLLVRQSRGLRGRQAVYVSSAVVLVVLSVWAANLFSSVHRFGAP